MTPFETLVFLRHRLERVVPLLTAVAEPPVLTLCPACRDALLNDLDHLFVPVEGRHVRGLEASQVMGFTFDQGLPEQCGLHEYLQKDAVYGEFLVERLYDREEGR